MQGIPSGTGQHEIGNFTSTSPRRLKPFLRWGIFLQVTGDIEQTLEITFFKHKLIPKETQTLFEVRQNYYLQVIGDVKQTLD